MNPEERAQHRIHLKSPFLRDTRFYEQLTPQEWVRRIEKMHGLEAFQSIPLGAGEITDKEIMKVHNIVTALAFGHKHVPFIVLLQADATRSHIESVSMMYDSYFGHEKNELIARPEFYQLSGEPQENVKQLRGALRGILGRQAAIATPTGLSFVHADNDRNCLPGVVALAGTDWASLAVGRLVQGSYQPLLMTQKR